jgi:hypothetical protein
MAIPNFPRSKETGRRFRRSVPASTTLEAVKPTNMKAPHASPPTSQRCVGKSHHQITVTPPMIVMLQGEPE